MGNLHKKTGGWEDNGHMKLVRYYETKQNASFITCTIDHD